MVFGTFDILHPGHEHFFKQARRLVKQPYLIVSVARDNNVFKIKGHKPQHTERQRLIAVRKNALVDKVVLGSLHNHIPHIIREKPDVIALGYDQRAYTQGLRVLLEQAGWHGRVVRLKAYKPRIYKTRKILARI